VVAAEPGAAVAVVVMVAEPEAAVVRAQEAVQAQEARAPVRAPVRVPEALGLAPGAELELAAAPAREAQELVLAAVAVEGRQVAAALAPGLEGASTLLTCRRSMRFCAARRRSSRRPAWCVRRIWK
jgi:hypothetical protein